MKVLCVAEKNSIAKAVSGILGGGRLSVRDSGYTYIKNYDFNYSGFSFAGGNDVQVTMTSVAGHLTGVDFAHEQYGWGNCRIEQLFDAPLNEVMDKNQQKIAANIRREAKFADVLMIWTDCDREGEYIGWEVYMEAQKSNRRLNDNQVYRAVFSHLERSHILQAAHRPHRLDMRSVNAVRTRIEIDLRAGVTFTRLLTETMRNKVASSQTEGPSRNNRRDMPVISYGTCQFPTLGFVVDRFERIRHFIPEEFWYIQLNIKGEEGESKPIQFQWDRGRLFDRFSVLSIYEMCLEQDGDSARVSDIKSKPTSKYKPLPLTTVELQKNCARFLRINAKQSLDAAEKLYQRGFISYPRTETNVFPSTMDLKSLVEKQAQLDQPAQGRSDWAEYAANLLNGSGSNGNRFMFPRSGNRDDKAHPPIHPIVSVGRDVTSLNPTEKRVYEYICRHFLASCSADAKGQQTTISLDWSGERFYANGLMVTERNFLDVYPWARWETTRQLPRLEINQQCKILKAEMKNGSTSPPKPMTESELIVLMDANGIGTDATIAEHIEKIQMRSYVQSQKVGKETYLQPTILGRALVHGFEAIGLEDSFAKPFQRREMEEMLRQICDGATDRTRVVSDILSKFRRYWNKTNGSKNTLLEVYDRTLRNQ